MNYVKELKVSKVKTGFFEFDDLSMTCVIDKIHGFSKKTEGLKTVITPNVDHLSRLVDTNSSPQQELLNIYKNASLLLCDSQILKMLMNKKGKKIENVIPGSTLTKELFDGTTMIGSKVLILGADKAVYEKVCNIYPNFDLYHLNPSMGFINKSDEIEEIVSQVKAISPNYIFLAVGSPRQELLAKKLESELLGGVALCIGASILFLVGEEKRAPSLFQKCKLEWLYRMVTQKRLIRRYLKNFVDLPKIYKKI